MIQQLAPNDARTEALVARNENKLLIEDRSAVTAQGRHTNFLLGKWGEPTT
jgi:hypothetical protein